MGLEFSMGLEIKNLTQLDPLALILGPDPARRKKKKKEKEVQGRIQ